MVVTRRSTSPSLSDGSTMSVSTTTTTPKKSVVFASSVTGGDDDHKTSLRRRNRFSKPPKQGFVKGIGHIHFHNKKAVSKAKQAAQPQGADGDDVVVQRVKLQTGVLCIYKNRKAEFVRTK